METQSGKGHEQTTELGSLVRLTVICVVLVKMEKVKQCVRKNYSHINILRYLGIKLTSAKASKRGMWSHLRKPRDLAERVTSAESSSGTLGNNSAAIR